MSESNGISYHSPVAVEATMSTDNGVHVKEAPRLISSRASSFDNGCSEEEYIIPGGISMLDISTRLRIKEAELNIIRRDYSELLAERNSLEGQSRKYEDSWKFTLQQLGRAIEQRNEALLQLQTIDGSRGSPVLLREPKSPEGKYKKMKSHQLRIELESTIQQLNTQIRVSRQLEHERDKANDDYEFTKAQLETVMLQHQDLLSACNEVARQRDKAIAEAEMLREELKRYDNELHNVIEWEINSDESGPSARERTLLQQIKLLREQRDHLQVNYQQTVDQYKRQLSKISMDKRNAVASADAMRALLQRKLDSAQVENSELRADLRTNNELVNQLKDQLAQLRITQQQLVTCNGDVSSTSSSNVDTPNQLQKHYYIPLSQGSVTSTVYTTDSSLTAPITSSLTQSTDLISPGSSDPLSGYIVHRTKRPLYVPTASPFPEETQENSSSEENSSYV